MTWQNKRPANRRTFIKTTSGLVAAGVLAGCLGDDDTDPTDDGTDDTPADDIPRDSKLFFGQDSAPVSFDPTDPIVLAEQEVYNLIFSPILNHGEGTEVVPHLATDLPEVERNGTRYIFEIVDHAEFHHGEPVTAEDVKYSLEAPMMYDTGALPTVEMMSEITALDETTVQIDLDEPYPPVLQSLVDYQVVPKDLHEEDPEAFGVDVERRSVRAHSS